ncbi:S9 family peptidase [Gloeobacter violaceus]|uniref:Oligopeptidase n=1 Tax=Gloeobacter violaceus (strain ATCC 29082 / PCC 7421) TaxID=251221 RepID=Q7NPC6_GLOVI|nr:oligopeptidase B [Gloeobacter violaceus]BAC88070.1 oligopeptidase [Gloeobacter violaceus PCC 7421]
MKPPIAEVIPKSRTLHGETLVDDYFWLREKDNPIVITYLEAENRYTEAVMQPTEQLQQTLYAEMLARIKQTDLTAPELWGGYYYYRRTEEGKQYPILCRKPGSLEAAEAILLDQNELARDKSYFRIGTYQMSPDQHFIAYSVTTTGAEVYTIFIKDLKTGETLAEQLTNASGYGFDWAGDNKTLFYTVQDAANRPYRICRHTLGTEPKTDPVALEEKDELFILSLEKTRSDAYLLATSVSKQTSEVSYLRADDPTGRFITFAPRRTGVLYSVDHRGDRFYILTDENAKNGKLLQAPVADPAHANWQERLPHRSDVKLDGIDLFKGYMVVYERENALKRMRVYDFAAQAFQPVAFDEPVYTFFPARNPEFDTEQLRFTYTSLVTPSSVYDYDLRRRTRELKKQETVYGYDPALYTSERQWAVAPDGERVPISLVYKKGRAKDGTQPLLLYGYGAYGISMDPGFSSGRLSLLERGFAFAIAHIRGGGEMGRAWYDDGKLLKKKNTFSDFIACAESVISEKYTTAEKLAIYGGSAGGLLMGAVVNLRPELFKSAIAKVPFVDVVNTMLDPSLPLTVGEYEEWGNPNELEYFRYIRSYSPYDNIEAKAYPNLLLTTGINDSQVPYWEPAKWAAKLRKRKTDNNVLLLKTNMGVGHGGSSGRYDALKEVAFDYAYLLMTLGVD